MRLPYARINLSSQSIDKQTKAQSAETAKQQARHFAVHEPPLPDGVSAATCPKTRAQTYADEWRRRSEAFGGTSPPHPEYLRSKEMEARWLAIRDKAAALFDTKKALTAACPPWEPVVPPALTSPSE